MFGARTVRLLAHTPAPESPSVIPDGDSLRS